MPQLDFNLNPHPGHDPERCQELRDRLRVLLARRMQCHWSAVEPRPCAACEELNVHHMRNLMRKTKKTLVKDTKNRYRPQAVHPAEEYTEADWSEQLRLAANECDEPGADTGGEQCRGQ